MAAKNSPGRKLMTVPESGNVGIGTANLLWKLDATSIVNPGDWIFHSKDEERPCCSDRYGKFYQKNGTIAGEPYLEE